MASNFSSWDVASVERKELNCTVLERRGSEDAAPDRNLFPYLLGFREGITTLRPARLVEVPLSKGGTRVEHETRTRIQIKQ
jgi:hypothetical protein